MKYIITFLCINLSLSLWANDIKKEELLGTDYFSFFEYQDQNKIKPIFEFEDKLINQALWVENYLSLHPDYQAPNKKYTSNVKLAMNLVYAAMFILNNNNGVIEGRIHYNELTQKRKFSTSTELRDEVIERYNLASRFLKLAMQTAPDDDRIPAWYSANILRLQLYRDGKVQEDVLDTITNNAIRSPIFHLFNALTMNSNYDFGEERENKLIDMVDFMNSKDSPCRQLFFRTGEAKKCNTSSKTPFAYQGVTVYMGDVYLKAASKIFSTDPNASAKFAQKAQSLYTRVDWFIFKAKAEKWKMIKYLQERRDLANGLIHGENKTEHYFVSKPYTDIYTCVSCHQDGTSKTSLHLRLPE